MDSDATSHNQDHWHSDINSNNALINHNPLSSHLFQSVIFITKQEELLLVASNPCVCFRC
ncbi:BBT_HP_G0132250.mRNA.1.CDS.1 [Saccharomyces cerevisiae]|nr:BBT_HP_G0132250.mRNA.1.CDS.1 [Saccharomyces cerevisiae]CAI6975917.1 BBT_HP_G0132250.mRNA.1.CDS.1 [Saccharomyces cerevisiae]